MTRLTSDVDALNELFTSGVIEVLGDVVMIFAIIGIMLWMDWRLTLVTLVTVPLLFAATTWFRKHARRGYDLVRTQLARINSFLQEHLSGAQTVQIFNREEKSRRAVPRHQRRLPQRATSRPSSTTRSSSRSWISSAPSASRSSSGTAAGA